MKTIDELMTMPWTWLGPAKVSEDGNTFWESQVRELPGFFVAGATADEVHAAAEDALRSHLMSYIEAGEEPPLPIWSYPAVRSTLVRSPAVALPTPTRKVVAA